MGIRRKVINCSSVPISKRLMLVFTQDWAKKPQQLYFPSVNPPGFVLLYRTLVGLVQQGSTFKSFFTCLLFQSISKGKFQIAPFRLRSRAELFPPIILLGSIRIRKSINSFSCRLPLKFFRLLHPARLISTKAPYDIPSYFFSNQDLDSPKKAYCLRRRYPKLLG